MISYLEGKIIKSFQKSTIVLVGGVGYKIFISDNLSNKLNTGESVSLFTYLNVKEDALDLYGFETEGELELFELLISISGVGPKAALGIVSLDSPDKIAGAILREDFAFLSSVSGIGTKTGKKIILELKDKMAKLSFEAEGAESASSDSEVIDALEALGYSERDARDALRSISKDIKRVEDKIREALKILGS
jgi:Holliday junction DNA helicase RuvA